MQSGFANVFPFGNSGFNVAAQAHGPRSALAARLRGVRQDGGDFVQLVHDGVAIIGTRYSTGGLAPMTWGEKR
jgi:hypothetical protein